MPPLLAHLLLALAVVALAGAGLRAAAALGASGALRVLAAVVIAASAAALTALALAPVNLGSSPVALPLAAGACWLAAARFLPAATPVSAELGAAWRRQPGWIRVATGAGLGALLAVAVWDLARPGLAGDGLIYHVPIVAAWVAGGDPGSLRAVSTDAPLEAYPLATELLVTWAAGISRSYVAVSLANPAMVALFALAGWVGLRAARVPRGVAVLAVAALAVAPLLVTQLNTFTTDVPALAWLAACAALSLAAVREPRLFAVALLAGGLAIGTKTTALPLAAICLVAAGFGIRGRFAVRWALVAAAAAAAILGGIWYARNLVVHGSPFWPFVAAPWGDDPPRLFELFNERLLRDPGSADGRADDYWRAAWGCLVLLAGGLLAPLWAWRRAVLAASGAVLLSLILWANAPNTAFPPDAIYDALQGGAVRYLLPGIAAAVLALALSAAHPGPGRWIGVGVLAAGGILNLVGDARLGLVSDFVPDAPFEVDPILPTALVPLAGALAGTLVVLGIGALALRAGPSPRARPAALAAGVVLVAVSLTIAAAGYTERSTEEDPSPEAAVWIVRQPAFAEGDQPVASQGRIIGTLGGDELRHQLALLPDGCDAIRAAADRGWVVVNISLVPEAEPGGGEPAIADYAREVQAAERGEAACLEDRGPVYEDASTKIYAPPGSMGTE